MKKEDPFESLMPPCLTEPLAPFSLYSPSYEKIMAERGTDIRNLETIMKLEEDGPFQKWAPYFYKKWDDERIVEANHEIEKMLAKYKGINGPCSMKIKNLRELEEHILTAYKISFAHYVLGLRHVEGQPITVFNEDYWMTTNEIQTFPEGFCGETSESVMLTYLKFGYANAARVQNYEDDHCYVLLPFVMEDSGIVGTIISDPTSDQMWGPKKKVRNSVFVMLGKNWEYITDKVCPPPYNCSRQERRSKTRYGDKGSNLYPKALFYLGTQRQSNELHSRLTEQYGNTILDNFGAPLRFGQQREPDDNIATYFDRAFANPIDILRFS